MFGAPPKKQEKSCLSDNKSSKALDVDIFHIKNASHPIFKAFTGY